MPFPGFIYWGLFVVCGAVWIGYALWMRSANARDTRRRPAPDRRPPA